MNGFDQYQSLGVVYEQTDGRLAIELANKVLAFPDRSWTDVKVGICQVTGIRDKGTYAFVTGHMVKSDVRYFDSYDDTYRVMKDTEKLLYGDPAVHVKYVSSDTYGTVGLLLHGQSEVLAVYYNGGKDDTSHPAVLKIGRRINFALFPLASDGNMYSFGHATSYLKQYTPTDISDCIVSTKRNKLKTIVTPDHEQYFPDKYFTSIVHDGPAYITGMVTNTDSANHRFVLCWNYNYQAPSEDWMMRHVTSSSACSNFAARAYTFIDHDHDSYGVCVDVIDRSGLVNISEVYGIYLSRDIYGTHSIPHVREVKGVRLSHRELDNLRYISLTDHDDGWISTSTMSRFLVDFDLAIAMIDPEKLSFISNELVTDRVFGDPDVYYGYKKFDQSTMTDGDAFDVMIEMGIVKVHRLLLRNKSCFVILRGEKYMNGLGKINNTILQAGTRMICDINRHAKSVMPNTLEEYKSLITW